MMEKSTTLFSHPNEVGKGHTMKRYSEMTPAEFREHMSKMREAAKEFNAIHGNEPRVVIVDEDGAVHSVSQRLLAEDKSRIKRREIGT